MSKRSLIVTVILALAVAAYLIYTLWPTPAADRPTLMYFRADL